MPTNKNAMFRYKVLDRLLSDRNHDYTMDDLTEIVSERLFHEYGAGSISRRTIEKDIQFLEYEYDADIERIAGTRLNYENNRNYGVKFYRYADRDFSIFRKELADDDAQLISGMLSMVGQIKGLPNFDKLKNLMLGFGVGDEGKRIISIGENLIADYKVFEQLFTTIVNKQVVEIKYHPFGKEEITFRLSPYQLKEYNRRWYLIAAEQGHKEVINLGLDRIKDVKPMTSQKYSPYEGDIDEWFEDIVGVTNIQDKKVEHILFWVGDYSMEYVETKPIHESQKHYKGEREEELRRSYPEMKGGAFFSIDCKENYELIRELMAFGANLIVLSPSNIRQTIKKQIQKMQSAYEIFDNCEH